MSTVSPIVPPRTLIVTGASSGIGRAIAIAAARDGFDVLLVARRAARIEDAAATIRANGGTCATLQADVTAADAPDRIVRAAVDAFGGIDVLINNAGAGAYGDLLEQTDAQIEAQWQLHVAAPLRIARAALPYVERSRGQLVFFGSGLARVPLPKYGAYAPAKAAIRAACTQMRRELRDRGVMVTYVDPGFVATEFHEAMGVERSGEIQPVQPGRVAAAVMRGVAKRRAVVNAVPWQTFGTIVGECAATLADPATSKMIPKPVPAIAAASAPVLNITPPPPPRAVAAASAPGGDPLERALEPLARRMERVKLPAAFVRSFLVLGTTLELNEIAMRWAGMPNKNERAAMREVLDALALAGFLEPEGEESWVVVRAAG